ncbi:MAG: rod shape-determining protein MreC [Bacilli bacterium]|nr:rod shape-determining protein MreC [Bacilli bacterium]
MNKMRPALNIVAVLFLFIITHNAIMTALGNTLSFFRENNRKVLYDVTLKRENEHLKQIISEYEKSMANLKIYEDHPHVLGKIAIRNIYDFYDFLIIAVDNKVENNSLVLNEHGLVGIVEDSNKTTAKVKLLTGKIKLSVKIGETFGMLDLYDKTNKEFIIHNIDNYKKIEIGTEVTTSGLQEIAADIPIGKVKRTEQKGVEQIVYVEPFVDFDSLNYLMVLS